MYSSAIRKIEKEEIRTMRILSTETLHSGEDIRRRFDLLSLACELGNSMKGKVSITFMTDEGPAEVTTTVWNVSPEHITLKSGALIPIVSIFEVRL